MLSGIGADTESAPWSAFASMFKCPIQRDLSTSQPIGKVLLYHDSAEMLPMISAFVNWIRIIRVQRRAALYGLEV